MSTATGLRAVFGALATAMAAALIAAAAGCASRAPAQEPLVVSEGIAIQDVTVVDTASGALSPHMTVLLAGGKIKSIMPNRPIAVSGSAQTLTASGRYLVPGFLDMHTHVLSSGPTKISPSMSLLVANGVTGIREMSGSAESIRLARQLNADRASGVRDTPEILQVPGELIIGATSAAAATAEVQRQKGYGADFIKLISANRDASLAVLSEAKARGLAVAGHLSPALGAADSSDAGWHSIEHLGSGMGFLLDCSLNEGGIRNAVLNGEGTKSVSFSPAYVNSPMLFRGADVPLYQRIFDSYSEQKCSTLMSRFVRNGTWNVPTLIRLRTIEISNEQRFLTDPNLIYVDKAQAALWQSLGLRFGAEYSRESATVLVRYYGLQQRVVKLMQAQGVKMMAGSDSGGAGVWMIPGFSLHQEFAELAGAGLTPLQVLQTTTLNGAQYLGRESTMGSVSEGKNADLVLLDGNPVESVVNLNRIAAVFVRGKYLSKEALEQMKRNVALGYSR